MKKLHVWVVMVTAFLAGVSYGQGSLRSAGFAIGPKSIHNNWKPEAALMSGLDIYDKLVSRIQKIVCAKEGNKSVMIISEPSDSYRYILSRIANKAVEKECAKMNYYEIDQTKIDAGHQFVGQTDKYWLDNIIKPASRKPNVLFFKMDTLIGKGTSSNDETGVEADLASRLSSGEIRSIGFMDKYAYARYRTSKHAYVINSFAEIINLEDLTKAEVDKFTQHYLKINAPNYVLTEEKSDFLYKNLEYYQPNLREPQRTLGVLKLLIRNKGLNPLNEVTERVNVESPHPLVPGKTIEKIVRISGAKKLQLKFRNLDLNPKYDLLTIYDLDSNKALVRLTGKKGQLITKTFETSAVKIVLKSKKSEKTDKSPRNSFGFSIKEVIALKDSGFELSHEDLRRGVLEFIQVPEWFIERDYSVLGNLEKYLDAEVVGVTEAKRDLLKMSKVGYVAGRTDEKPIASALLVGPTGTGKSYIAKKMAEGLGMRLITIDMTAYKDAGTFNQFSKVMTDNLTIYPYAIYLFEEIDKANYEILDRLYFFMDEGIFYDRNQRPIFGRGAFLLFTSNAAQGVIIKNKDNPKLRQLVMDQLTKQFRPSFLNRFEAISLFTPFTDTEYENLAKIMLLKKAIKMQERLGWNLQVGPKVIQFLGKDGQSKIFGARPMERSVENVVSFAISEYILTHGYFGRDSSISITAVNASQRKFKIKVDGSSLNAGKTLEFTAPKGNNSGAVGIRHMTISKYIGNVLSEAREF